MANIRTTSLVFAQKELYVTGNIFADEFTFSKGKGEINSISAKVVSIGFRDKRTAQLYHNKAVERKSLVNPVNLIKFVGGMIKHSISRGQGEDSIFIVKGDIHADEIYLSNCVVEGDVKGNNVVIGENVEVQGKISYSKHLELTEKASGDYKSEYDGDNGSIEI